MAGKAVAGPLRHSFGAHLRMAGASLADIGDLMGHKDLTTPAIYAKVQQEHLRSVIGKLMPLVPVENDVSLKRITQPKDEEGDDEKLLPTNSLVEPKEELAGRQGFEPRYHGPEPCVLPLNDLPAARFQQAGNSNYSHARSRPATVPPQA